MKLSWCHCVLNSDSINVMTSQDQTPLSFAGSLYLWIYHRLFCNPFYGGYPMFFFLICPPRMAFKPGNFCPEVLLIVSQCLAQSYWNSSQIPPQFVFAKVILFSKVYQLLHNIIISSLSTCSNSQSISEKRSPPEFLQEGEVLQRSHICSIIFDHIIRVGNCGDCDSMLRSKEESSQKM